MEHSSVVSILIRDGPGHLLPMEFEPSSADVICGWARQNYSNAGNKRLRDLVAQQAPRYVEAKTKDEKGLIITTIVKTVMASSPTRTGFVRQDKESGRWFFIGIEKAKDKIGHALRKACQKQKPKNGNTSNTSSKKDDGQHVTDIIIPIVVSQEDTSTSTSTTCRPPHGMLMQQQPPPQEQFFYQPPPQQQQQQQPYGYSSSDVPPPHVAYSSYYHHHHPTPHQSYPPTSHYADYSSQHYPAPLPYHHPSQQPNQQHYHEAVYCKEEDGEPALQNVISYEPV